MFWNDFIVADIMNDKLDVETDLSKEENKISKNKWHDYVSIRAGLFETQLKSLFGSISSNNKSDNNNNNNNNSNEENSRLTLFSSFNFTNRDKVGDIDSSTKTRLFEQFLLESRSNISFEFRYLLIYNGIYWLFYNFEDGFRRSRQFGRRAANTTIECVATFKRWFMYKLETFYGDAKIGDVRGKLETELDKIVNYLLCDIENEEAYHEYNLTGIKHYAINRMTFLLFNDWYLAQYENKNTHRNASEKILAELAFPNDCQFYKLLNDCIIYLNICPIRTVTKDTPIYCTSEWESMYINLYFLLSKELNNKDFLKETKFNLLISSGSPSGTYIDGTLMHNCVWNGFEFYCQVLIHDGVDFDTIKESYGYTGYDLAIKHDKHDIISKMEHYQMKTGKKINSIKAKKEQTEDTASIVFVNSDGSIQQTIKTKKTAIKRKTVKMEKSVVSGEIETAYFRFCNQITFAKYLLFCLGFEKVNSDEKERLGLDNAKFRSRNYWISKNATRDCLYFPFEKFEQLKDKNVNVLSNGQATMNLIVKKVILLIEKRSVVSEDMLILCFEYLKMINKFYTNDKNLDKESVLLLNKFKEMLSNTVRDCLDSDYQNKNCKLFYYQWFKEYFLYSNIWLCNDWNNNDENDKSIENIKAETKTEKTEETEEKTQEETPQVLLYESVALKTVTAASMKQKDYIWNCVENEEKCDRDSWNSLLNFKEYLCDKYSDSKELRQDGIKNGIKLESDIKLNDMYIMLPLMEKSSNFNIFNVYNTKIYLTKCLIFSYKMNKTFQSDVKSLFNQICNENNEKNNENKIEFSFAKAPVKLESRCLVKCNTDYAQRKFPNVASILDFLRCSITFTNSKDMLYSINKFVEKINNLQGKCLIKILRIKNGFKDILNWKSHNDCEYKDIKINVIVYDKLGNQSQVGEIQFLLSWLLKAKKIGHKLYGIVRRQEFIDTIENMVLDDLDDYDGYVVKIKSLVENGNINHLTKELIWRPHIVGSIIDFKTHKNYLKPYFWGINGDINPRIKQLFWGLLIHFQYDILGLDVSSPPLSATIATTASTTTTADSSENDKKNSGKEDRNNNKSVIEDKCFLSRYFNFEKADQGFGMIDSKLDFFGINPSEMKPNSFKYIMIDTLLGSDWFNGMNSFGEHQINFFLNRCASLNCFHLLKLILKHKEKNWIAIRDGMKKNEPLSEILRRNWCSKEWIELLLFQTFDICKKDKVFIHKNMLRYSFDNYCVDKNRIKQIEWQGQKDNVDRTEYAHLVVKYAKMTNQYPFSKYNK